MARSVSHSRHLFTLLCVSSSLALTGCGGGESSEERLTSTLGGCFDVTPGTAYTMTDGDRILITQEAFEGATRNARVSLQSAGTRRIFADYWSRDSSGVRFWGSLEYQDDVNNTVLYKTVSAAGHTLPTSLQLGQSVVLSYVETATEQSTGQTSTQTRQETWTFTSLVTQTLGGRPFVDMCRMDISDASGSATQWWAKGFGVVRYEIKNVQGTVLETGQLDIITAQP
jgi:hypothetical protein